MIHIEIPDGPTMHIEHLLLDFNGTIACDGSLIEGVAEAIVDFDSVVEVHVVTGNTFNTAEHELNDLPCKVVILPPEGQANKKHEYLKGLGPEKTAVFGNGHNDRLILKEAAVGVAVLGPEGAAVSAIQAADVMVREIGDAFALLKDPYRLKALLRG